MGETFFFQPEGAGNSKNRTPSLELPSSTVVAMFFKWENQEAHQKKGKKREMPTKQ